MGEINRFEMAEMANKVTHAKHEIIQLYKANDYNEDAEELMNDLERSSSNDTIRIVFIGQYDAGKSTIISALTGDKEIVIDSDVATKETKDYKWDGVIVTDTPGLYTENIEHDQKTIETIKQADLLVYCITSDLFNQYTLEDFKNWAFTLNYSGKMFLVINKMLKEAGPSYELLQNTYTDTINLSLQPHSINEFSHSFIDAEDYRNGIKKNNTELVDLSHFESFISALNRFVNQKGMLGKFDKPISIMKSSIDKVTQRIMNDDSQRAFTALLSRIERKIDQQRNKVSLNAKDIVKHNLKPIIDMGYDLSRTIGIEDNAYSEDDVNGLIKSCCQKANEDILSLCNSAVEDLNTEIDEVLGSDTANYFFNSIGGTYTEKRSLFESKETKITRSQFNAIKRTIETVAGKTISMSTKEGSVGIFIKASEAAGSQVHKAIYTIGKSIGYNFKPWQAANITKNIGNIAKFMGPLLSIASILFDLKEYVDENEKTKAIQKAQIECRQEFIDIASDLELQYNNELRKLYDVYDSITKQLQDNRESIQNMIRSKDATNKRLLEIRNELVLIQTEIF